jgi:hypothetical protein
MRACEQDAKIALLATVDPNGLPHVSLITSLQAKGPREFMFGQFSEGLSKRHVLDNPRVGFLVMSADRRVWRGRARWTHTANRGADFDAYNDKPMFRYNAYFGIHTVHYLDLVDVVPETKAGLFGLVGRGLLGAWAQAFVRPGPGKHVLTTWAKDHLSRLSTLKFLAAVDDDGYPTLAPLVPARAAGNDRLLFAPTPAAPDLRALPAGRTLALFALNLQMESVLVRGVFDGYRRFAGVRLGVLDLDWVYNSMPPKQGRIYPPPVDVAPAVARATGNGAVGR